MVQGSVNNLVNLLPGVSHCSIVLEPCGAQSVLNIKSSLIDTR